MEHDFHNLHEKLDQERFKGVYAKIDANYELVNTKIDSNHVETTLILKQILAQTKKTNGRVTKLEDTSACKEDVELLKDETQFFRLVNKYPKFTALAILGLVGVTIILGIETIFKIF